MEEISQEHYNPATRQQPGPNRPPSKNTIRLPLLVSIALVLGLMIGSQMSDSDAPLAAVRGSQNEYSRVREVLTLIENNYVDEVNTEELVDEAISVVLDKLDPHTVYIPAEELEMVQAQLQGGFEGIGIEFNIIRDTLYVVAPLSGGPSEEAGLQSGDQIIKVDGETISGPGLNNQRVFESLRGPSGSEVVLDIKRKGEANLLSFTIERDKIPNYAVDASYMVDDKTGYIKVNRFSATSYDEFVEALERLKSEGMQQMVLDLQGNPGGLMDQATKMVDEMLGNDALIVYTDGKGTAFDQKHFARREGIAEDMPVIVLVDEGSASASEIVAGALQDNDRALIVGRRSFGKGLVQMPMSLSDGSELRLTISRYYTPSGRSIQKPFGENVSYDEDLMDRYEHGELFSADSINFADSLAFTTVGGRQVYGGGGIMPDYFVPLDTTGSTPYMRSLFYSNAMREFTLFYYEENAAQLEAMSFQEFMRDFRVTDALLDRLVQVGEENDVEFNRSEFEISRNRIATNLKAFIARSVWENNGFYPIFNQSDEVYLQALQLFDKAADLMHK